MKQLTAFTKKEFIELYRTGKLLILTIVFVLFGIMNPAFAKLTPWIMNMVSGSLAEAGMTIAKIEVNAMTSWNQFYKNIPMLLIVFVIMFGGILTTEYQRGTLINMLTKGLSRWKVIAAKFTSMMSIWTLCYWLSYGITYVYNDYYWDNGIASHLFLGAFCIYLLGIWMISLVLCASSLTNSNSAVLLFTGGVFVVSYLISMVPTVSRYLPTQLLSSQGMLTGAMNPSDFTASIIVTLVLTAISLTGAVLAFNRKRI